VDSRIILTGDIAPGPTMSNRIIKQDSGTLSVELEKLLSGADLVCGNLEAPVTSRSQAESKCGPALALPPALARGLRNIGFSHLALANNHAMDYGAEGLRDTQEALAAAQLSFFGAGDHLEQASTGCVLELGNRRVGLLAAAAHEFGMAAPSRPGVFPMDPGCLVPRLMDLRQQVDYLILLLHAGSEMYPYPAPWLQSYCRMLARCGADLVSCQHSHMIGCMESWQGSTLLYGQGNFMLDLITPTPEYYRRGLMLELRFSSRGNTPELDLHLVSHDPQAGTLSLLPRDEAAMELKAFHERSQELTDPALIQQHWEDYCSRHSLRYRSQLKIGSPLLAALARKLGLKGMLINRRRDLLLQNLIRCQDHQEALRTMLEKGL
jgi:hypothetical protein